MVENKKVEKSPLEIKGIKSNAKNVRTIELLKIKEIAQKKLAESASTSDHHDNSIFSHGPSNRGK
jgi:hypothetical protein